MYICRYMYMYVYIYIYRNTFLDESVAGALADLHGSAVELLGLTRNLDSQPVGGVIHR